MQREKNESIYESHNSAWLRKRTRPGIVSPIPIRRTLAVKRKGRQVFRASLKVRQYATFIANAIGRIRRNNGETLRSLLRSAKKALDGATYTENMEREEGRKSSYPRDRTIEGGEVDMGIEEGGGGPRGW